MLSTDALIRRSMQAEGMEKVQVQFRAAYTGERDAAGNVLNDVEVFAHVMIRTYLLT